MLFFTLTWNMHIAFEAMDVTQEDIGPPFFSCHCRENKSIILAKDNEVLCCNDPLFSCSLINVHENVSVLFFEQFQKDPSETGGKGAGRNL